MVVPAIQQLSGGSGEMPIKFFADYLDTGMGLGEVFAQNTDAPLPVGFNGKQSGGVATPNLTVSGLSRKFGTVSGTDPTKISRGQFDPSDIFQDLDNAKLFGDISLADLLKAVDDLDPSLAPILTTHRLPNQITTTLSFTPKVPKTYSALGGFIELTFNGDQTQALILNATIVMPLAGGDAPGHDPRRTEPASRSRWRRDRHHHQPDRVRRVAGQKLVVSVVYAAERR